MIHSAGALLLSSILQLFAASAGTLSVQTSAGDAAAGSAGGRSLLQFITAGGWIGYLLIALSVVGIALVVNAFLALRKDQLMPPRLHDQVLDLAQRGRFVELLSVSKAQESALSRTIAAGLDDGKLGVEAVREGMLQQGENEITQLHQRVGYIGLIAAVAPVLGLLGTVSGMMASFGILGASKGAARPDELAVGIAEALVTTCMGLVLAVPMMFFHTFLRNRVTNFGQLLAATCDRLLRIMAAVVEQRQRAAENRPAGAAAPEATAPKVGV